MRLKSIFLYDDYRTYLCDFYNFKKNSLRGYTYKKFSERAGLHSPNFLKLVSTGKKNLSPASMLRFAVALELTNDDTEYFEALVMFNQAEDPVEKAYYKKRLAKQKVRHKAPSTRLGPDLGLFDHPLLPAALVLLSGAQESRAKELLGKHLGLKEEEAESLLSILVTKKIMTLSAGRKLNVDFEHGIFYQSTPNLKMKAYLRQALRNSEQAFEKLYDSGAKFNTHVMGIQQGDAADIENEIRSFFAALNEKYHRFQPEKIYQLNVQSFALEEKLFRK